MLDKEAIGKFEDLGPKNCEQVLSHIKHTKKCTYKLLVLFS